MKKTIFEKFKSICQEDGEYNIDIWGNEYYMYKGIKVIHVTKPAVYKWNDEAKKRPEGYYILLTIGENFATIEDPISFNFLMEWDGAKGIYSHLVKKETPEKNDYETHTEYRKRVKTNKYYLNHETEQIIRIAETVSTGTRAVALP